MTRSRRYSEVDVFAATPYRGNPLAVVHDAEGLSDADMQQFANWTNLAETTFLLAPTNPQADYRVRIFTASEELPFAGHPTLGSARAWLDSGGAVSPDGVVVQECAAGLVSIRVSGDRFAFQAPPLTRYEAVDESHLQRIADVLGIRREEILDSSWIVNGPRWIGIRLHSAQDVLELRPDPAQLGDLEIGVVGPYGPEATAQFEVRAFFGGDAVWEDPVTGSLNAGLARWLMDTGAAPANYVASQGTVLDRQGRVHISVDGDVIWVGGHVSACISGSVLI
ncbi:phenazine biosynthesis protein PhzF family [Arthrobacter alpinus]|uniref:Phenazine biosynthesis protein PhzF family n=1 Tax=Arthrobacter alpinus TaxID=656366 RepID=A0A1H5MN34_9MICC|nr:PhzF family phenazine biosynthesis protein [Arthrobacter alpinus]SEE90137.1 phenazine biosynthesis protein PhzF family [Arthrobacter alpinus]